jgi:hypothetical protein
MDGLKVSLRHSHTNLDAIAHDVNTHTKQFGMI